MKGNGPSYEELLRENERLREELRGVAERDAEGYEAHRALVDSFGIVLLTMDSSGRIELVSNAVNEERWGSADRIRGTSALDHVHPEDRIRVARAIRGGLSTGEAQAVVYRLMPPTGEMRPPISLAISWSSPCRLHLKTSCFLSIFISFPPFSEIL